MGRQFADPVNNGNNAIVEGPPATVLPAPYLNDWLIGEIEGFVKRQGIELSADDLTQLEQAILTFIEANAATFEQGTAADDSESWLLGLLAEAGLTPDTADDGQIADAVRALIETTTTHLTDVKLLTDQDDLLAQPPGWYGWTNPAPINAPPSNTPTFQIAHIANAGPRNYKITSWSTGDQETWTNYKVFAGWRGWDKAYTTRNTTTDSNGNLRPASPIFRVSNAADDALSDGFTSAGAGVSNAKASGVTATHPRTGHYVVSGSCGFATDGAWPIPFVIPQDGNGRALVFVETEQADDGTIEIRTYKPAADGPFVVAGEPIDIPAGRWIDLRLSMPKQEEPEDQPEDEPA